MNNKLINNNCKNELVTLFPGVDYIPDSSQIATADEWYLLNHISSPLIQFDHIENRFVPLLAKEWSIQDNVITFTLDSTAKFHDGENITATDVAATIKRLIIRKTATHFPVWEYFKNCENIKSITDDCDGIQIVNETTIHFVLAKQVESFFLLMASPEGGVCQASSIDKNTLNIVHHKFSGPYYVDKIEDGKIFLLKNNFSPIHKKFPNSPNKILALSTSGKDQELIKEGKVDVFITGVRPFASAQYDDWGFKRHISNFSTILFLSKVGDHTRHLGQDFFNMLWLNNNPDMAPAETFLPFNSLGVLNKKTFLEELPQTSSNEKIRIAFLSPYFKDELIDLIVKSANTTNETIVPVKVNYDEWMAIIDKSKDAKKVDYVLEPYVASERYPSVQLRYMLEGREPPFKLDNLDLPVSSPERKQDLEKLERWMIRSQNVLPLFFTRDNIIYKSNIDIGKQPISDSEIQLWRVQVKHE